MSVPPCGVWYHQSTQLYLSISKDIVYVIQTLIIQSAKDGSALLLYKAYTL